MGFKSKGKAVAQVERKEEFSHSFQPESQVFSYFQAFIMYNGYW